MGRTIIPYTMQMEMIQTRLKEFRRALRVGDRELFDGLMREARKYVQSGVMAAAPDPFHPMALSMLLSLFQELEHLKLLQKEERRELQTLQERCHKLEKAPEFSGPNPSGNEAP